MPLNALLSTHVPMSAIYRVWGAFFMFSCVDTCSKYLVYQGISAPFVSWSRFFGHVVVVAILYRVWANPRLYQAASPLLHMVRAVMILTSGVMVVLALRTIQLVEFISVIFLAPIIITVISSLFLGETVERQRWLAVGAGMIGVLIITRPGFGVLQVGHLYAVGAMLTYCMFSIMTRSMSATETSESLIFLPAVIASVVLLPAVPLAEAMPQTALEWGILSVIGVLASIGHILLVGAYRQAPASALAPYAYLQIVWTVTFGYLIFDDLPDQWTTLGTSVIIVSGLYLLRRDRMAQMAIDMR